MESNNRRKYQKPEIFKVNIDNLISLLMMSGGTEQNAPHGPFGEQNKIQNIRKNDPFKA